MHPLQIWILAARPKTLIASISPVCIGTALAINHPLFNFSLFLFTLATAIGIQITTNFANDYFDFLKGADTSERKGPLRVTQAGLISPTKMKRGLIGSLLITGLSGSVLIGYGGWLLATLLLLSLVLSILYTGGPYPLAYLGLGELFVFLFFGIIAVSMTYYLQTRLFSLDALVAGIGPGLLSTAILIVNNLRDVQEDTTANKKTLIVRFGSVFGKIEYIIAITLPILSFFYFFPSSLLLWIILTLFIALTAKAIFKLYANDFSSLFAQTGQQLWLYTLLFCVLLLKEQL